MISSITVHCAYNQSTHFQIDPQTMQTTEPINQLLSMLTSVLSHTLNPSPWPQWNEIYLETKYPQNLIDWWRPFKINIVYWQAPVRHHTSIYIPTIYCTVLQNQTSNWRSQILTSWIVIFLETVRCQPPQLHKSVTSACAWHLDLSACLNCLSVSVK